LTKPQLNSWSPGQRMLAPAGAEKDNVHAGRRMNGVITAADLA
jgi:hypothetical protein